MAGIALLALLQVTLDKLGSAILKELGLFRSLRKDIQKLKDSLSIIRGVLTDAEEKQQTVNSVKEWLKQVKDASYDADDILDQCATEALRRRVETEGQVINKACDFFSASNPFLFDLHMVHKIKDIRERLDDIAGKVPILGLMQTESRASESREETHSHIIESDVKGREEDKEKVVELLLNVDKEEKVSVISIIGMGGLGKTTLAKLVYKDVARHFDLRIWVSVSDDFDVRRLTKKIIESARKSNCNEQSMELLQQSLRKELSGKKFLLVLDDVWNKDSSKWDSVRSLLLAGETGSKIMVTARNREVALIMGTRDQNLYPLSSLSDDVCWYLFRQRAFGQRQEQNQNLVVLGKEIVRKCGGIPLAANALGSLMGCKRGEDEWKRINESEIWNLIEEDDSILPVLRLSYNDLSSRLKLCFAYCSIFPKDHHIKVEELIRLWMAEGFIQPSQGSKPTEEEIGRVYFNKLLSRSFFQDADKDDGEGNVISCKMHDLMHDLAQSVSEDARSIVSEDGEITIPDGSRHLSVENRGRTRVSITLMPSDRAKKLRTLLLLGSVNCMLSHKFVTHLPCLRVLYLDFGELSKDMLNSIGGLKQLRYLCLSIEGMQILPNSLSKLHNLQTLRLIDSEDLNELPRDMRKMVSLRHLQVPRWRGPSLTHMPAKMGELTSLQTLPVFVVGEDSGRNIRQLGNLKYLSGELGIQNLENVKDAVNAQEAKLSEKANLRSLGLSWSRSIAGAAKMLEGLQPHRNLRCLRVENYGGDSLPRWMGGCGLPNLVELSLRNWRGSEQVQLPGQFRSLKSLSVSVMDAVKCIGSDFYGDGAFPSLEEVTLTGMANLEEWSVCNGGRQGALASLKRLEAFGCPKLSAVPCFPLLTSLRLSGFEAENLPNRFFQNQLTYLSVVSCQNLESLSRELGNVVATLEELMIDSCPKLISLFPEEMQNHSPRLRHLSIYECDGLTSLRLQGLASLTFLSIDSCKNLASFVGGMHHLTALQHLDITECPELLGALADGMEHLTSLTSLYINGNAKVTQLPEGLKHATRLQDIYIEDLPNLSALPDWIGNLSSLQTLMVNRCPNLVSLPSGFQHLTNLRSLEIYNCHPELEKRCEKETGEDWHKISHIPSIDI